MFREDKVVKQSINYEFLINYLKERIIKDEYMDKKELKKILIALDVKFEEIHGTPNECE